MWGKGRTTSIISIVLFIILVLPVINLTASDSGNDVKPSPQNSPIEDKIDGFPDGWSEDVRLSYSGNGIRPSIATKDNVIHTAWDNRSDTYEISYRRSFDNGRTWESERIVTNSSVSGTCYFPDISINNSTVHIVYSDDRAAGRIETYYLKSIDNGDTWSEAIILTDSNLSYSQQAKIASWNDNVYVVWLDERNGGPWEIYYKNSSDAGDTWSDDRRLTFTSPDSFGNVEIKVNDTNLHIAYCMRTGSPYVFEIFYMNSTDGGINWSTPVMISQDNDAHSQDTSLAINGSDIHIVWQDSKTGSYDIFYRNSTNGGISFNPELRLTDSSDWETEPCIFADNDNLTVVFSDDRDQPGTGSDIYIKNSTDGGVSWDTDTRLTFTPADKLTLDSIVEIYNGTTHVLWMDQRDISSYETYYKRYPDFPPDPTYNITLTEGWNLISLPLEQRDESLDKVLENITGKWDKIFYYDASEPLNHWKSNATFKPQQLNDLYSLNRKMGFWINITEPGGCDLTVSGAIPTTTEISLKAGWNMVGYPTLNNSMTVGEAFFGTGATRVEAFNASAPYNVAEVGPTYIMKPGEGYWVHVPADSIWVVDW